MATENEKLPTSQVVGCPRKCVTELLNKITGYQIEPYESDWLTLELTDIEYETPTNIAYIVYVCRIPEKTELKAPYNWANFPDVRSQLERIRGVF